MRLGSNRVSLAVLAVVVWLGRAWGEYYANAPDPCLAWYNMSMSSTLKLARQLVANITAHNGSLGATANQTLGLLLDGLDLSVSLAHSDLSFLVVCDVLAAYFYSAEFADGVGNITRANMSRMIAYLPADQSSAILAELAMLGSSEAFLLSNLSDLYSCLYCDSDDHYHYDDDGLIDWDYVAPSNLTFCGHVGESVRVSTALAILNQAVHDLSGSDTSGDAANQAIVGSLPHTVLNDTLSAALGSSLAADAVCASIGRVLANSGFSGDAMAYVGVHDLLYELGAKNATSVQADVDALYASSALVYEQFVYSLAGDLFACLPCPDLFVSFSSKISDVSSDDGGGAYALSNQDSTTSTN
jgi:hypothetical protein